MNNGYNEYQSEAPYWKNFSSANFFLVTMSAFAGYLNDLSEVKVLSSPGSGGNLKQLFIRKNEKKNKQTKKSEFIRMKLIRKQVTITLKRLYCVLHNHWKKFKTINLTYSVHNLTNDFNICLTYFRQILLNLNIKRKIGIS